MERLIEPGCPFCYPRASNFSHFRKYGVGPIDQYIVLETENFQVKPDVLPGNPDGRHVIVFPKSHVYNHAGLVEHTWEVGNLMYELERKFGPLVVFEHGGLRPGNKVQSVYHAHFHAYGGLEDVNIIKWMKCMLSGGLAEDEIYPHQLLPAPNYAFLANLANRFNGTPYLYVEQGSWAIMIEDSEEKMKSQITQRSMHQWFSGRVFDWKLIPQKEEFARESVRRILNLMDFCQTGKLNTHGF